MRKSEKKKWREKVPIEEQHLRSNMKEIVKDGTRDPPFSVIGKGGDVVAMGGTIGGCDQRNKKGRGVLLGESE